MPIWKKLYGIIWLIFFAFLLVLLKSLPLYASIHAVVGVLIILVAIHNRKRIAATGCPVRIKRIAFVMVAMSILALLTGVLLKAPLPYFVMGLIQFLHIATAAGLFTQSASVATSFDMWQEKEF
ncbi:MAG: hypothetical protein C0403_17725 [Desulfobacterium sp.]|nr:hypothetical protein [Desulfobacterium sp.]